MMARAEFAGAMQSQSWRGPLTAKKESARPDPLERHTDIG
jgi:hypothetical protein